MFVSIFFDSRIPIFDHSIRPFLSIFPIILGYNASIALLVAIILSFFPIIPFIVSLDITRNRRITPSIAMYFAKSIFYFILMKRCFYIVKNIIFCDFGVNANYIFSIPQEFLLKFLGLI